MKTTTVATACLAALAAAAPAMADLGDSLYSAGGHVTVEILPSDAGYTSDLSLVWPAAIAIGSNRDTGLVLDLGEFTAGTEMIFQLTVRDTGDAFQTGPAARNPDGLIHANVTWEGPNTAVVGFEDLYGGGDQDYNDCQFRFTGVVPAPGTIALAGLGGLCCLRRRR
jgi:hypothetical protein